MSLDVPHYVRNSDFIFRKIVEEVILVPVKKNIADMDAIFTLNEVGAFIWGQLENHKTLSELKSAVTAVFDADPETLEPDLTAFLQSMTDIGAINRS